MGAANIYFVDKKRSLPLKKHAASDSADVSVIVVNWNLKDHLRSCLESVRNFRGSVSVEIIVIDNGSTDGSIEMMEREFADAKLVRNRSNLGFARASNEGMAAAAGRYLFLFNNDARLFEGALPRLVEFMDRHPDVGLCGPRVSNPDGTLQVRSKGFYPSIPRALGQFFVPGFLRRQQPLGFYEARDLNVTRDIDWLSGCALMARREAVEDVGLLDDEVFMYLEDVDWCYRMRQAGWKVVYVPQGEVLHYGGVSMKKQKGKVVGSHAASLVAFYKKYHGQTSSLIFKLLIGLGYGIKFAGWLAGALVGRGAGYDKLRRLLPRRGSNLS